MAALISSTDVARLAMNSRSTTETFGVGTRIATPSSLPFRLGQHQTHGLGGARAEVGIIDKAAARARYRSLCMVSSVG